MNREAIIATDRAAPRALGPDAAMAAEHPLTLEEAIARALEKNEGIAIERESLTAAAAAVTGAGAPTTRCWSSTAGGGRPGAGELRVLRRSRGQVAPTRGRRGRRGSGSSCPPAARSPRGTAARGTTDGLPGSSRRPTARSRRRAAPAAAARIARSTRRAFAGAAARTDEAAAELARDVTETVAAVERAYWTLAAARRAVEVREEAVRLAEEQLAETAARIESGAAPETEIAQPRAELERRRGELLAARESCARAPRTRSSC